MTIRSCIEDGIDCKGYGYHELRATRVQTRSAVQDGGVQYYTKTVDVFRAPCVCHVGRKWARDRASGREEE